MRRRRSTRSPRAFVLIEIMMSVALFALFAAVAMRMISVSLRVANDVSRAEEAHRSFDAALSRLRADAWTASAIEDHGQAGVTLKFSGSGAVTWSVDAEGALSRTEADGASAPQQAWPGAGDGVTLSVEGSSLLLQASGVRGNDAGAYRLSSFVLEKGAAQ